VMKRRAGRSFRARGVRSAREPYFVCGLPIVVL
jgi:hypothetical protein